MTERTKNILSTSIIAVTIALVSLYLFTPQGRRAGNAAGRAVRSLFTGESSTNSHGGEKNDSTAYEFGRPAGELENLDILTLNNTDSLANSIIGQGLGTTDSIPSYYRNEPLTGFGEGDIGVPPQDADTTKVDDKELEKQLAAKEDNKPKEEAKKTDEKKASQKLPAVNDLSSTQAQLTEIKKEYKKYKDNPNEKLKAKIEAEKEAMTAKLNKLMQYYREHNKTEEIEEVSDMFRDLAKLSF